MYVRMSGHTFDAAERLLPALRYVCIHMMSYHRYVWMYVHMSVHMYDAADGFYPRCATCASSTLPRAKVTRRLDTYACRYVCISTCIHMIDIYGCVYNMSGHTYNAADGFCPCCATCASRKLPRANVTIRLDTCACRYVCIFTCIHMIDIYGSMYICLGIHVMQQTASARAVLRARRGNYPQQTSRLD